MHSLLVNWCRHSVEPHALTCPFKRSNLSAWSLLSWHPTHTHLSGRLILFFEVVCSPPRDHFWSSFWFSNKQHYLSALHRHGHTKCLGLCQQKCFCKTVLVRIETKRCKLRGVSCGALDFQASPCTFLITIACRAWKAILLGLAPTDRSFKLIRWDCVVELAWVHYCEASRCCWPSRGRARKGKGSLWERGTSEIFKLSGTYRNLAYQKGRTLLWNSCRYPKV